MYPEIQLLDLLIMIDGPETSSTFAFAVICCYAITVLLYFSKGTMRYCEMNFILNLDILNIDIFSLFILEKKGFQ